MIKTVLKNIIGIVILVAILYVVTNYFGQIQNKIGVKGASTSRAKEISGKIGYDVGSQLNAAEKQVMQLKISDIVNGLSRFQRVPQDINSIKSFVQTQVSNVLQSKDRKK